ncbi:flagellar hook-associated protein FlgK [uncultured Tateyamaria sp.]|uniref:flagellar hook-associated protein FlgK n=1 Tax=uncultured Tateyamaria sp. TaxID=455651 RepID=UPI00260B040A|nr:flagellar hook-associated protein FlgK [uncultured Tateyamaria sp.]
MTITSALNSAMSGLRAASRASELVSSNIANVSTPGYARRTLSVSSSEIGAAGGVRIDGIQRHVDAQVIADRRLAGSEFGYRSATTNYLSRIEDLIGTPDQSGSLSARLADFENSLITAASRPDAAERLDAAAHSARDLAVAVNSVADGIQTARTAADREIGAQVTRLNDALQAVQLLNSQISGADARNADTFALQDQRQVLIDEISEMVPVRMIERDHGAVALYSTGGAILIDGRAAEIGFETSNVVTPYMSIDDGSLSGLTINGFAVNTTSTGGRLQGGTLGAQFEIRDELAPEAQSKIDALARNLVERFEDAAVDPTLSPGDPGLFTDDGAPLDPAAETGLANRLSINALVDPTQSGETRLMRDGLGSVAPGPVGDSTLLNALTTALSDPRVATSGSFGASALSAGDMIASVASQLGSDRLREDQKLSFASTQFYELTQRELAGGVDTDVELQNLMIIEQAYAANARVIETVDQMFDSLLRI